VLDLLLGPLLSDLREAISVNIAVFILLRRLSLLGLLLAALTLALIPAAVFLLLLILFLSLLLLRFIIIADHEVFVFAGGVPLLPTTVLFLITLLNLHLLTLITLMLLLGQLLLLTRVVRFLRGLFLDDHVIDELANDILHNGLMDLGLGGGLVMDLSWVGKDITDLNLIKSLTV